MLSTKYAYVIWQQNFIYNIFIICQKNNKINKITYKKEHVQKNKKNIKYQCNVLKKKLSKKSPEHILGS